MNSLTISIAFPSYEKLIFCGNRPLEKMIILDLLELTLSFQILQYSQKKYLVVTVDLKQNPKIKLYHQHIVTQRVLNKYQNSPSITSHTFLSSKNCWRYRHKI